ncbi:MAG: type II secretion system protein M [Gammaproteobacteria bacterium]|nr:type II secretion system protein M [Gammaproteobacteria bacterium]NNJ85100.1 type II secretion system protein M [Gammaproteobacteria bacterium]
MKHNSDFTFASLDAIKPRDRIALAIGGVVIVFSFLWFVVAEPLQNKAEHLVGRISKQDADLRWMQRSAEEIHRLRKSAAVNQGTSRSESLLTVVDRSAKKVGLIQTIKRIEPAGEEGVRVWIEAAVFDNLLLWLGDLRVSGVHGISITVERQKTPGRVNAKVTLGWL